MLNKPLSCTSLSLYLFPRELGYATHILYILSPNSHKSPQNSSNTFTTCIYVQFKSYLAISLWYFTTEWLNPSTPVIHLHRSYSLIHVRSLEHPQHNSPSETRGDPICRACTPVTNHIASPEHVTYHQTTRAHVSP